MLLQSFFARAWRQARHRLNLHRRGPIALCGALAAGLILAGCTAPVQAVPTPTPWPTPELSVQQTYRVEPGRMIDQFHLLGEVVPVTWEPLAFPIAGNLATIYVRSGDSVEEGALLADLAMPELLDALEQARLDLAQAETAQEVEQDRQRFALERAQLDVRRAELLLAQAQETGDPLQISLQQLALEEAQLNVREAESQIDPTLAQEMVKAQMIVASLERQVAAHQLRAPMAGQIVAIGVGLQSMRSTVALPTPGTAVEANTTLMILAQPEPTTLVVAADSMRASELTVGQVVTVTHRWTPEPFSARVTALPTTSSGPQFVPGFPGSIHLTPQEPRPAIAIGEPVDVLVVAAVREEALVLPEAAVRRFAGRTFVVLQDDGRQRRIDVQTGLESDGQVEILAGLQAGDVVVGR